MSATQMVTGEPWSSASSTLIDDLGVIHGLKPKVLARAERVVRRTADPAIADEVLQILGLTEVSQ